MAGTCSAVIVAGGKGLRMNLNVPKQYIKIKGKPILAYTIDAFHDLNIIDEIILVVPEKDISYCENEIIQKYCYSKINKIVAGGVERQFSVCNGLKNLSSSCDTVLIHDSVRPFVESVIINQVKEAAQMYGAAVPCVPVKDSIKRSLDGGSIEESADRTHFYLAQTPQGFQKDLIISAYAKAFKSGITGTDDSCFAELAGIKPVIVAGCDSNIKITTKSDLAYAEFIINSRGD